MKFRHADGESGRDVWLVGDLTETGCGCLQRYWQRYVHAAPEIRLHLADLDVDDGAGLGLLTGLLSAARARGASLTLLQAPQMVAHNLYKLGLLRGEGAIQLVEPRNEEPYG